MAGSLIPDTGNVRTNTAVAMRNYLAAADNANKALLEPGKIINDLIDRNMAQEKMAEDKRRFEAEMAMRKSDTDYARGRDVLKDTKERMTNEAIQATLDPSKYGAGKMAGEQAAIQSGLANLSPEERVVAEAQVKANYNPSTSREQWITGAVNGPNVNQANVLEASKAKFDKERLDPNSDVYKNLKASEMGIFRQQQGIAHANRMAEIGASKADRKEETYPMFTKQPDGSLISVEVPKSQLDSFRAQGYSLGKLSNIPAVKEAKDEKGSYTQKDVDTLVSKFDPWTITGGSRNEATALINSLKKVHVGSGPGQIKEKDFNDVIGSALTISSNGDSFSKSLFEDVVKSNLLKNEKVAEVVGGYKQPVAAPQATETPVSPVNTGPVKFTLPAEGATITLANIKKDSEMLRNAGFGPKKPESYIKDKIDAKYGIGAYDRVAK